jgi:hypothetical protein
LALLQENGRAALDEFRVAGTWGFEGRRRRDYRWRWRPGRCLSGNQRARVCAGRWPPAATHNTSERTRRKLAPAPFFPLLLALPGFSWLFSLAESSPKLPEQAHATARRAGQGWEEPMQTPPLVWTAVSPAFLLFPFHLPFSHASWKTRNPRTKTCTRCISLFLLLGGRMDGWMEARQTRHVAA